MSKRAIVFRLMTENDVPALLSLYQMCFEDRPSEKYLRWRYLNAHVGGVPAMLAFDQETCVGSFLMWPVKMMLDDKEVLAGQGADAMIHPKYRGRDIIITLAEKCYEFTRERGYQFYFGFPHDNALKLGIRRLNWDHVCEIDRWVRPLWIWGTSALSGRAAAASLVLRWASADGRRVVTDPPKPELVAALASHHERSRAICRVKRDSRWFEWRYHTDSDRNYQWITVYEEAELKGAGVWRLDPVSRQAFLCELIGDLRSARVVLDAVLGAACAQKARAVQFPTNDSALIPVLKSRWFVRRRSCHLVTRSAVYTTLPANIHWNEAWRVYGGDVDFF